MTGDDTSRWSECRTAALARVLERARDERVFPGCTAAVFSADSGVRSIAVGTLTYERQSPPVTTGTIYDVASLTKVIPTSTLALRALEEGRFTLDTPVVQVLPELRVSHADRVLVRHLLTHTLDWGFRLSELKDLAPQELLARILSAPLKAPPGERFFYSNATSIVLGMVVERALGAPLSELARKVLFAPVAMASSTFGSAGTIAPDAVAPSEDDSWRGTQVRGSTHDETAWVLGRIMTPGSAGLFSTVGDIAAFGLAMLRDWRGDGPRVLSSETLRDAWRNQLGSIGACAGLGWEHGQSAWMGSWSQKVFGKTGFTGCCLMLCPEAGTGLAILANWTWPHRRESRQVIDGVRSAAADVVFG